MNNITLPGYSTINSNGQYHFESGYPSNARLIVPCRKRGTIEYHQNACVDFIPDAERIYLPPVNIPVACGDGYHVKRTSRNYIIQVKVPICETRRETESRLKALLPEVVREITINRRMNQH